MHAWIQATTFMRVCVTIREWKRKKKKKSNSLTHMVLLLLVRNFTFSFWLFHNFPPSPRAWGKRSSFGLHALYVRTFKSCSWTNVERWATAAAAAAAAYFPCSSQGENLGLAPKNVLSIEKKNRKIKQLFEFWYEKSQSNKCLRHHVGWNFINFILSHLEF